MLRSEADARYNSYFLVRRLLAISPKFYHQWGRSLMIYNYICIVESIVVTVSWRICTVCAGLLQQKRGTEKYYYGSVNDN